MSEIRSKPASQAYRDNWPFAKEKPTTREEAERVCTCWGINEPERMTAKTPSEAISEYLEQIVGDDLPKTIHLSGYVPMKVSIPGYCDVLENVLDALHEEYGDPDVHVFTPTPAMRAAEEQFIKVILAEYQPYMCEDVYHEDIVVADWLAGHTGFLP